MTQKEIETGKEREWEGEKKKEMEGDREREKHCQSTQGLETGDSSILQNLTHDPPHNTPHSP
jgi:hypothetical protein